MSGLPGSLADFGPAAFAAVVVAVYLVAGEPVAGHVLHRRFEGRLRTDPGARRSFYGRLLVLEWGLALLALVTLAVKSFIEWRLHQNRKVNAQMQANTTEH